MEGELTGQVAVIPPDRPEWEEADEPVPVLIGKFLQGAVPRYEVDSPVLEALYPVLLERHGASWRWNADDLAEQTLRVFNPDTDVPPGVVFQFPPPLRAGRARWTVPPTSPDFERSISARMAGFHYHPLVFESAVELNVAFEGSLSSAPFSAALEAQNELQAQLVAPATRLAFQFMHKTALCELGTIGVKIRNQLRFENPKTHKPDTANKVRANASLFGVKNCS